MSPASLPTEALAERRFSFYPAIRNVEHNDWSLVRETWSEMLVANVHEKIEVWIPRTYVTGVSSSDSPLLIVGLSKELEFKAGSVWPYRQKIVEMPDRRGPPKPPLETEQTLPAAGPPSTSRAESSMGRFVAGALLLGMVALVLAVAVVQEDFANPFTALFRPDTSTADQRYLGLTGADGYHDVALRLGSPESEQWLTGEEAQIQFRLLQYQARSYAVILMGGNREEARYIGTLHLPSRRALDTVKLSGGGTTAAMLRNLPDF